MAATSATGTGLGSADGQNKGSEHMTLGVGHLIGPRVMASGSVALDGGGLATIVLAAMPGVSADYFVMVGDASGTAATTSGTLAITADSDTTLTLDGTATNVVKWAVIKIGTSGLANATGNI